MSVVDIVVPRVNANDDTVEVLKWFVDEGGFVEAGRPVLDLGTTKAAVSVESPSSGFLVRHHAEGAIVPVGGVLAQLVSTTDEIAEARRAADALAASPALDRPEAHGPEIGSRGTRPATAPRVAGPVAEGAPRFSCAARDHVAAAGIDAAAIGLTGLVTARRLRSTDEHGRRQPLDRVKRAEVAALLSASDVLASSVSVEMAVAAGPLLPHIIRESAALLADYPALNGCFADGAIMFRDAIDLGVALDLGRGLRVVTIRGAHARKIEEIERQLYDFTDRDLSETLRPDDLAPATFTITDLSSLGASAVQPLIGEAQAAILGVSGGTAAAGTPLVLTLVFDHRVSNGRMAAMFLSDLRDRLERVAPIEAEPALPPGVGGAAPAPAATLETRRCDRCNIALDEYYDRYPRDAFMQVWMRPDGSLGVMCHICASGVF